MNRVDARVVEASPVTSAPSLSRWRSVSFRREGILVNSDQLIPQLRQITRLRVRDRRGQAIATTVAKPAAHVMRP